MEDVSLREFSPDDLAFVKATWLSHQSFNEPYKHMNVYQFKKSYSDILDQKIPTIKISIACNKEFPEQIYGYIAYNDECLHFIYVKGMYRKMGLSKIMIASVEKGLKTYTHLSDNKHFKLMVQTKDLKYNKFGF